MHDLVRWLGAQLDEDERIARDASADGDGRWSYVETRGGDHKVVDSLGYTIIGHYDIEAQPYFCEPHIARHDPARVLREIDAKRKLMERMATTLAVAEGDTEVDHYGALDDAETALCLLALPYADRPGYQEKWRP